MCAINPLLHSLSGSASCQEFFPRFAANGVFVKAIIDPQFHRSGNLKEVAGFKKQTELYPCKCRSKSTT